MKKIMLSLIVCVCLFLVGCSNDLPPEPGAIGGSDDLTVGGAISYATSSFGPPYDINEGNENIFSLASYVITLTAGDTTADVDVNVDHDDGFIYKYGYYYTFDGWEQFTFSESTVGSSNWIRDSASVELDIDVDDLDEGQNFVVAYSCKLYGGSWKCGCDSVACGQWMIQEFDLAKFQFPDSPTDPEDLPQFEEDSVLIKASGNKLNIGESIADIRPNALGDSDLPNLLRDGVFEDSEGANRDDYSYTQHLAFTDDTGTLAVVQDDDDAPDGGLYLVFDRSLDDVMYEYDLHFDDAVIYDASSSNLAWMDLVNLPLNIQGEVYGVVSVMLKQDGSVDSLRLSNAGFVAQYGGTVKIVALNDSKEVEINGINIDGSEVVIYSTPGELDSFMINYVPEDKIYLAPGDEFVDPVLGNFKFVFAGFEPVNFDEIRFETVGQNVELIYPDEAGVEQTVEFVCEGDCDAIEDGITYSGPTTITTDSGAQIVIQESQAGVFNVVITEPSGVSDGEDSSSQINIGLQIDTADEELHPVFGSVTSTYPEVDVSVSDNINKILYTDYGTRIDYNSNNLASTELIINLPEEEISARVFVTAGPGVSIPSEGSEASAAVELIAADIGDFVYASSVESTTCELALGTCEGSETATYTGDFGVAATVMSFDAEVGASQLRSALPSTTYVAGDVVGDENVYLAQTSADWCYVWVNGENVVRVCGESDNSPFSVAETYLTAISSELNAASVSTKDCTLSNVDLDGSGVVDDIDLATFSLANFLAFSAANDFYVDDSNQIDFKDTMAYIDCFNELVTDDWAKPLVVDRIINAVPSAEFDFQIAFKNFKFNSLKELAYYDKAIVAPHNKFQINPNFYPSDGMIYINLRDASYSGEQTIELETDIGVMTVCLPDMSISGVSNFLLVGDDGSTYWLNEAKTPATTVGSTFWYHPDLKDSSLLLPLKPGQLAKECD
ncbi:hypothetical protein HN592_01875 [Candidatus Woesearchaeota archaeon]|jgi:hypothetical protein|nr:hypothetical protein [Candidatus Woesearchaeota archaeon]MBT4368569.1 hypothetical protein [Candidatus Woesearchaeota archaeon]MBT4713122.1 hypothetical protein [Candidatus Woesearchaeota archaeon]MBT6639044.1 hypothetical protein [Candidatus Woesearchaeota archaeon]MBT7134243.1 hypothetical protein [Candidatus Woesearchaeota archaeon]